MGGRPVSLKDDDCLLGRRARLLGDAGGQRTRPPANTASTAQMLKTQRGEDVTSFTHRHRFPALNLQKADEDDMGAEQGRSGRGPGAQNWLICARPPPRAAQLSAARNRRWVWLLWRESLSCRVDVWAAAGACCLLLFGAAGLGGA